MCQETTQASNGVIPPPAAPPHKQLIVHNGPSLSKFEHLRRIQSASGPIHLPLIKSTYHPYESFFIVSLTQYGQIHYHFTVSNCLLTFHSFFPPTFGRFFNKFLPCCVDCPMDFFWTFDVISPVLFCIAMLCRSSETNTNSGSDVCKLPGMIHSSCMSIVHCRETVMM